MSHVLWHRRMGHMCMQNLQAMVKKRIVTGINSSVTGALGVCEPCIMGKQCRAPFYRKEKKSTRPLELVHTDVCGPITPETWNNKTYFVVFVVLSCLREYHAMVVAGFDLPLSRLRLLPKHSENFARRKV